MTTWGDVVIGIPTMPQRDEMLSDLLSALEKQGVDARCVVHRHPDGGDAREDLPALIDKVLAWSGQRPWVLLLEDDVHLSPVFGERMPVALTEGTAMGWDAMTFFSRSAADLRALERGETWRRFGASSFCMMQAVAVRTSMLAGFSAWSPGWYSEHPEHVHAADLLLAAWLSRRGARMAAHVPSLVQHRRGPSTLPGHRGARRSQTYELVFGDAP